MEKYVYSESAFNIQYTINWNKTQMLRKITLDKINDTKNALFFVSSNSSQFYF